MFELIKSNTNINFTSRFLPFGTLSLIIMVATVVLFFTRGLNYGVDFRGGAEVQVKFTNGMEINTLREALSQGGFPEASVQNIGEASENEYLIKVGDNKEDDLNKVTDRLITVLNQKFADKGLDIRKTDIVGPRAGKELRNAAAQAMIWTMLAIMIYIALRFEFKYGPGAVVSLFHDAMVVIFFFEVTQLEFNLQIVAAILAVIGYSVNDTVVIYDRIREHEQKTTGIDIKTLINRAVNETLSRTLITSTVTLFLTIIMVIFGGESVRGFFIALSVGMISGIYSTIYIASPFVYLLHKDKVGSQT